LASCGGLAIRLPQLDKLRRENKEMPGSLRIAQAD